MIQKCESGGMVYTADLKSAAAGIEGSNPSSRTSHRAYSSVGQSSGLIIRWSQVQVLLGPSI